MAGAVGVAGLPGDASSERCSRLRASAERTLAVHTLRAAARKEGFILLPAREAPNGELLLPLSSVVRREGISAEFYLRSMNSMR